LPPESGVYRPPEKVALKQAYELDESFHFAITKSHAVSSSPEREGIWERPTRERKMKR
jgi:hypothetical protein